MDVFGHQAAVRISDLIKTRAVFDSAVTEMQIHQQKSRSLNLSEYQ